MLSESVILIGQESWWWWWWWWSLLFLFYCLFFSVVSHIIKLAQLWTVYVTRNSFDMGNVKHCHAESLRLYLGSHIHSHSSTTVLLQRSWPGPRAEEPDRYICRHTAGISHLVFSRCEVSSQFALVTLRYWICTHVSLYQQFYNICGFDTLAVFLHLVFRPELWLLSEPALRPTVWD